MEIVIPSCNFALTFLGVKDLMKLIRIGTHRFSVTDKIRDLVMNNKKNIICLDLETTGLNPTLDEVLQLSIIDGCGDVLF